MLSRLSFRSLITALLCAGCLLSGADSQAHLPRKKTGRKRAVAPAAPLPYFLFLSDAHLNVSQTVTHDGADAGTDLWAQYLQAIKRQVDPANPPKFILYTGDLPVHGWNAADSASANQQQGMQWVLKALDTLAARYQAPVLYAPGNNDALAGNYHPFSWAGFPPPFSLVNPDAPFRFPYTLFHINERPGAHVPYLLSDTTVREGYWTVRVLPGLRVVCMNTVTWTPNAGKYMPVDSQLRMMKDEIAWLDAQLHAAAQAGDKVFLAMHVPPGLDAYEISIQASDTLMWATDLGPEKYSVKSAFLTLVETYDATITGIFFGHTHCDEVRLLYDRAGKTVKKAAVSCPGVSLRNGNNPAFKLVYFDPAGMVPTDFTTYYTPWSCPKQDTTSPRWNNASYRFSAVYACPTCLAGQKKSILSILQRLGPGQIAAAMAEIYFTKRSYSNSGAPGIPVTW